MKALADLKRLVLGQVAVSCVLALVLLWLAYWGEADLLSLDAIVFVVPTAVLAGGLALHLRNLQRRSDEAWDWLRQFEWGWLAFYVLAAIIVAVFGQVWWACGVALLLAVVALPAQQLLRSADLNSWLDERAAPRPRPKPSVG